MLNVLTIHPHTKSDNDIKGWAEEKTRREDGYFITLIVEMVL